MARFPPTRIANVQAVGLVSSPTVSFHPRTAGSANAITLSLVLSADIAPNETAQFVLPGFTGDDVAALAFDAATSDGNEVGALGSWVLASTTLAVRPQGLVAGGKPFAFTLAASNGIGLPAAGLAPNATGFTAAIAAAAGGVSDVPLTGIDPAGALSGLALALPGASAGAPAQLEVSFTLNAALLSGDTFTLALPGFTGASVGALTNLSSSAAPALNVSGSWDREAGALRLTVDGAAAADTAVTVTVPSGNGIPPPLPPVQSGHVSSIPPY